MSHASEPYVSVHFPLFGLWFALAAGVISSPHLFTHSSLVKSPPPIVLLPYPSHCTAWVYYLKRGRKEGQLQKQEEARQSERTEVNNWDENVNDTKTERDGEEGRKGGRRSPPSSHAVFEAGSWLDNRGSFIPQTQWANATMGVMPRAGLRYTEPHTQD